MMLDITKCYTRAAMTSAIATCDLRSSVPYSIAPSDFFLSQMFNNGAASDLATCAQIENRKRQFARMLSRSIKTGLFENVEMKMERTVALKKLGQLLGKSMGYRINAKAPSPDERAAAKDEIPAAIKDRDALKERRQARFEAILAGDTEYQTLKAAHEDAKKRVEQLGSIMRHHKITVGTSNGMFFLVKAEGDSWEEIIDKLTAKEKKAA